VRWKINENRASACWRTPSSSNNRLLNAAAKLQRCLEGDLQIFVRPQKICSAPSNRRCKFAAAIRWRSANPFAADLPRRAANLQRRLKGDWQIWRVFCNFLTSDFFKFLGVYASKNVLNIGSALTSQDLSIDTKVSSSKSSDTVPLERLC